MKTLTQIDWLKWILATVTLTFILSGIYSALLNL
jgi:hypothetical protein